MDFQTRDDNEQKNLDNPDNPFISFLQLVRAKETNLKTGIVYGLRKPPQLLELFWKKWKTEW